MTYYLIGGGDIRAGKLKTIDKDSLSRAKNTKVFIIDLTTNDSSKIEKYRTFLDSYFREIGAEDVGFVSLTSSARELRTKINRAGIIYIPGGDTKLLLQNIKKRKLVPLLKGLEAIIVGNSAGALALCKETILTKDEDIKNTEVVTGLSLVNFAVDVHYHKSHDAELLELSKKREIYAIPENCAIIYNGKFNYIGRVYKFLNGVKEKIN